MLVRIVVRLKVRSRLLVSMVLIVMRVFFQIHRDFFEKKYVWMIEINLLGYFLVSFLGVLGMSWPVGFVGLVVD